VHSVRQAILLLGVGRVRDITMATAVIDRFAAEPPFDAQRLWQHSIGVAICAQEIAQHAGLDVDTAYIAGLLHDIGQLLLFGIDSSAYSHALQVMNERDVEISEAERECLGVDHAQVGGALARLWKLPEVVAEAITTHHASAESDPETEMGDAIHVAEILSHALDLGAADGNRVPYLSDISVARMGIEWPRFAEKFPRIEARFDRVRIELGL
jgi:putative nucleotidyltransferase with HDIG domain